MSQFNKSIKKLVWVLTQFLEVDSGVMKVLKALELAG